MHTHPHIPPLAAADASPEVCELYDDFAQKMTFPAAPNFITTQGHSRAAALGTWGLVRNVLVDGEISRWIKEMIFVAISMDRNCVYCEAAHLACCRMLAVDSETLATLVRNVAQMTNPKLREMILFAVKCSKNPQGLDESDFEKLRQQGLRQSEIVELIAMSALAVYANILADATGVRNDAMFSQF